MASRKRKKQKNSPAAPPRKRPAPTRRPEPPLGQEDEFPIPPTFMGELANRLIGRILEGKEFASPEEMERFLDENFTGRKLDDLIEEWGNDPSEQAQMLVYEAMEAETPEKVLDLTRQALALDPDCVDAHLLLTMAESKNPAEAIDRVRAIIDRTEQKWGPEFMAENEGIFWGAPETRSYMRVRAELVDLLIGEERVTEAIEECRTLLRLNPNDNQGIRDLLLGLLLQEEDTAGAEALIEQFEEDESAVFMWGRALAKFQAGGADAAHAALTRAIRCNRHVEGILTGRLPFPESDYEFYSSGDTNEATHCLRALGMAWIETPGAMAWIMAREKPGRRKRKR